ncbi:MAG: DUF4400 domain-containing protein [Rhodocyclaceae bacterium]|nr:DUF4400 domain-containing protein [Rhodocyclaceae bacterium]
MTRHGLLWLFAIVAIFLFAPLLVPASQYERCFATELENVAAWFGEERTAEMLTTSKTLYRDLFVDSGIDPAMRKSLAKPVENKEIAPGIRLSANAQHYANHVDAYWANMLANIGLFCFRVAHALAWMLYLTPFLLAAVFDGIMTRKAKLVSFAYTSPTLYNLSWHTIIAGFALALVSFALVVPVSIGAYPIGITILCLLVRLVIANIQHSA